MSVGVRVRVRVRASPYSIVVVVAHAGAKSEGYMWCDVMCDVVSFVLVNIYIGDVTWRGVV